MRGNNQPWIRKYCPSRISEIVAQETAMSFLKKYLSSYKDQKKKVCIIYGHSGCGKTSSVYAIAAYLNLEVIEVNASDFRNKEGINSTVGAASQQMSLFGKEKLILVDEIDGVAGRKDYGGIPALVRCIQASGWPIVMTANNPFDNKFSSLRNKSEMLGFKELNTDDVYSILKDICLKENLSYDEMTLRTMERRSAGGRARC